MYSKRCAKKCTKNMVHYHSLRRPAFFCPAIICARARPPVVAVGRQVADTFRCVERHALALGVIHACVFALLGIFRRKLFPNRTVRIHLVEEDEALAVAVIRARSHDHNNDQHDGDRDEKPLFVLHVSPFTQYYDCKMSRTRSLIMITPCNKMRHVIAASSRQFDYLFI